MKKLKDFGKEDFVRSSVDSEEGGIRGCAFPAETLNGQGFGGAPSGYICDILGWVKENSDYDLRGIVSVRDTGWWIGCELIDQKTGKVVHTVEPERVAGSINGVSRMETTVYEAARRMTLNSVKFLIENGHTRVGYADGVTL